MRIVETSIAYCASRRVARTIIFSANRFAKLVSDMELSEITREHLDLFISHATTLGLSPSTIRGTLKDIRTLMRDSECGIKCPVVKVPDPEPEPTPLDDLSTIWPHCPAWLQQHLAITFHCCFRLADVIRLQIEGVPADCKTIRLVANKTRKTHLFPVPNWIRPFLGPVELPFRVSNDWSQVIVRDAIAKACLASNVSVTFPRNVRQLGLTSWGSANGMAGQIAHDGKASAVMGHYINAFKVLESAMNRVVVPVAWRGVDHTTLEDSVIANFRRLDQQAQELVSNMTDRLVG